MRQGGSLAPSSLIPKLLGPDKEQNQVSRREPAIAEDSGDHREPGVLLLTCPLSWEVWLQHPALKRPVLEGS